MNYLLYFPVFNKNYGFYTNFQLIKNSFANGQLLPAAAVTLLCCSVKLCQKYYKKLCKKCKSKLKNLFFPYFGVKYVQKLVEIYVNIFIKVSDT